MSEIETKTDDATTLPSTLQELFSELSLEEKRERIGDTKTTVGNLIRLTNIAVGIAALLPPETHISEITWREIQMNEDQFLKLFRGHEVTQTKSDVWITHSVYWRWICFSSREFNRESSRPKSKSKVVVVGGDKSYRTKPSAHNGLALAATQGAS